MYKVIKCFTDLRDDGHVYNVGDTFPRNGVTVDQSRLDILASDANRQGTPLIAKVHASANDLNSANAPAESKPARQEAPLGDKVAKPKKNNTRKKSEK